MLNKMTGALAAFVAMGLVSTMPAMMPVDEVAPAAAEAAEQAPAPEAAAEAAAEVAAEVAEEQAAPEDTSPVIATVDGTVIRQSELDRLIEPQMSNFANLDDDAKQMYREMLEENAYKSLIYRAVLMNYAKAQEITATRDEVEERVDEIAQMVGGVEALQQVMQTHSISLAELQADVRNSLVMDKVRDTVVSAYTPTDEEIDALFAEAGDELAAAEEVEASHILVTVDADATDEDKAAAKAKIDGLLEQVRNGGDFAALASAHSDCPSRQRGGDLGSFGRGQMVKPFEDAAFAAEIGKVTDVVETQFGYHIIQVTERTDARGVAIESLKEDHFEEWLDGLVEKAKIERPQS